MFGHVRGAFTDAHRDRRGRFALAEGGSIFLDEIGELDLRSQVKMLRVLQDRTYEVLGTSEARTLDVRVISATNRDLNEAVGRGEFREDLLYRLNLIAIQLPTLSERPGDIALLADHFLALAVEAHGLPPVTITPDGQRWLSEYAWPGNIRQLKHLIERAVLVTGSQQLGADTFERTLGMETGDAARDRLPPVGSMTLEKIEKSMILKSLKHHGGNISRAAVSLGMSRAALYRRLEKYGIKP
jgi:DNA-binding NtrC family response regulator